MTTKRKDHLRIRRARGENPRRPLPIDDVADVPLVVWQARDGAGLSQALAYKFSGVTQQDISEYENGKHVPNLQRLLRLLRAYKSRLYVVPIELNMVFIEAGSDLSARTKQVVAERDRAIELLDEARRELASAGRQMLMLQESVRRLSARKEEQ